MSENISFIQLEYNECERSVIEARKLGAEKLYICAGSSEETLAFYNVLGCIEAEEINS